jgi:hypothetical protein
MTAPRLPRLLHLLLLLVVATFGLTACIRGSGGPPPTVGRPTAAKPAPAPAPVPEPPAPKGPMIADSSWYKPRSSWAASQIDVSNIEPMQPIYRLTIHHSGDADDAIGDAPKHLRDFERAHQAKGWACIGYHFVIARDGTVYEARPIKYQGAHATGDNNIGNIGVCLMGNFDSRPIPIAQRMALLSTVDRLRKQYNIKRSDVYGHRDFKTTDCPGPVVMKWIANYKGD